MPSHSVFSRRQGFRYRHGDLGGVVGAAGQFAGGYRMLLWTGDGHAAERGFNAFGETERQRLRGGRQLRPSGGDLLLRVSVG